MEWNKQNIKGLLLVVCGGVAFYCALQNLDVVWGAVRGLLGILAPFLLGGALAFVLNVPMRAIERHLLQNSRRGAKLRRPLALVLTLLAVLGVLALASLVIGPGIADAVMSIIREIPAAFDRLQKQLNGLAESLAAYLPMIQEWLAGVNIDWESLSRRVLEYAQALGSGIVSSGGGFIGGVVSGVSTFVIGLIFSFYILLQKEKLSRHGRQVIYGLLPLRQADRTLEILRLASRTFSSFLSGQCLEACILGTLFAVAMTIFRMPYALLVGVLIALTALIPIVGAFIGCAVGALLIAIDDPWKALWFIVLFLVLQQIEGNLIYPHVVGSSVGLPSIWVLAAVTLGGSLMGITGMLFFIPLCSVLYALFRSYVKERLAKKGVPPEKWRDPPPAPPRRR
ncbi:AI-2E family transporter [Oscillibacter valericigenes]|uniref:AI-2E family transporter n=1 Tax=Oscillibacter valericigenes TaxID=351091 RepID=UPI001958E979|nr:AI-2E family transporter [Oscillibacter valericigenes]MBM6911066.1 AI-2E family transporter [Oscillibacter valericigenes]HJB76204.1 AI-2E family transporter [Candidatus Oscillibacter avistercoris]